MLFDDYELPSDSEFAEAQRDPDTVGNNLVFDWEENAFQMQDGSPVMVSGVDAIKEWLKLIVRLRQERYPIYPADFGTDALDMIGKKFPKGYTLSEFKRKVLETIKYNPGIDDAEGFTWDGEKIYYTLLLADGSKEVTEVEYRY